MTRQRRIPVLAPSLGGLVAAFLAVGVLAADLSTRHDSAGPGSILLGLFYLGPWGLAVAIPLCVGGSLAASALAFGLRLPFARTAFGALMALIAGGAVAIAIELAVPFLWSRSGVPAVALIALTAGITALFCRPRAAR